jgi:DNA-binding transcriptional LysR family regulator
VQTVLAMVAAGLGISLVPAMACRQALPPGLVLRTLGTAPRRDIIAHHMQTGGKEAPIAQKLVQLLRADAAAGLSSTEFPSPGPKMRRAKPAAR